MSNQHTNQQSNIDRARTLLSPYLDGEVSAEEQQFIETQLATSDDLRQDLESLRHTISMLAQLPQLVAPRPFTLSEADVGISAKARLSTFLGLSNWLMGWAAATAAVVVVLVISGTFFFNNQPDLTQSVAIAPSETVTAQAKTVTASEAAAEAKTAIDYTEDETAEQTVLSDAGEATETEDGSVGAMAVSESVEEEEQQSFVTMAESDDTLPDAVVRDEAELLETETLDDTFTQDGEAASSTLLGEIAPVDPSFSSREMVDLDIEETPPKIGGSLGPQSGMATEARAASSAEESLTQEPAIVTDDSATVMESSGTEADSNQVEKTSSSDSGIVGNEAEETTIIEMERDVQTAAATPTVTVALEQQPVATSMPTVVDVSTKSDQTYENEADVPIWTIWIVIGTVLSLLLLLAGWLWLYSSRKQI